MTATGRAAPDCALVIFDLDGVLVDSESIAVPLQAAALRAAGLPISDEDCARLLVGLSREDGYARLAELYGFRPSASWKEDLYAETVRALSERLQPVQGAVSLLAELDARAVPWCVATNSTRASARHKLTAAGLAGRCPGKRVFCAEDVTHGKPAPDLFLLASERCRAGSGRVVVVEDSDAGVTAATAAGMEVLRLGRSDASPAARCINRLAQVLDHVWNPFVPETGGMTIHAV